MLIFPKAVTVVLCLMVPEGTIIQQEPEKEEEAQDPEHISPKEDLFLKENK